MSSKGASFCPIPHTFRDQVWLAVGGLIGVAVGAAVMRSYTRTSSVSASSVPRVLDGPARVVHIPGMLSIDEHVGNAGNGDVGISIATVDVEKACVEATQRPLFDEYVLVQKGEMHVSVGGDGKEVLVARAGQMLHLPRGHLYTYSFPGPAAYVPVCLPAFRPELSGRIE